MFILTPCLHLPPHPFLNPFQFGFSLLHARLQSYLPNGQVWSSFCWIDAYTVTADSPSPGTLLLLFLPALCHAAAFL